MAHIDYSSDSEDYLHENASLIDSDYSSITRADLHEYASLLHAVKFDDINTVRQQLNLVIWVLFDAIIERDNVDMLAMALEHISSHIFASYIDIAIRLSSMKVLDYLCRRYMHNQCISPEHGDHICSLHDIINKIGDHIRLVCHAKNYDVSKICSKDIKVVNRLLRDDGRLTSKEVFDKYYNLRLSTRRQIQLTFMMV
jgi:hypothetical protein